VSEIAKRVPLKVSKLQVKRPYGAFHYFNFEAEHSCPLLRLSEPCKWSHSHFRESPFSA
jgi:hypothetical protein